MAFLAAALLTFFGLFGASLNARIDALDSRLSARIDGLSARMDVHLERHAG